MLVLAIGTGWDLVRLRGARLAPPPAGMIGVAGETPESTSAGLATPPAGPSPSAPSSRARVDLNRASAEELDRLPGIGPVLASRILAHRERHGNFRDVAELLAVPGIGPALAARLAPLVTIGSPVPP